MAPEIDAETFDDMKHALGRPTDETVTPYRNRYVCGVDSAEAGRFAASPYWRLEGTLNQGRDAIYRVTDEGVALVLAEAQARSRAEGLRYWRISYRGFGKTFEDTIRAKTRAEARYKLHLNLSDANWVDNFKQTLARIDSVRLA